MSRIDPKDYEARIGHVTTRLGGFFPGQGARVRGHDLHEMAVDKRWFDLFLLSLTGRQFAEHEIDLLEALWTYTSYPDPRIWNNRVAALAGSSRASAALGIGAAIAVTDADIYGLGPCLAAFDFIGAHVDAPDEELLAAATTQLRRERRLGGYGRPLTADDERIAPTMAKARRLGLADGPHVRTAFRIESLLESGRWRMRMNYAALCSAIHLDIGLTRDDYECILATIFLGGMPPVWKEHNQELAGGLFPTPVAALRYDGQMPRQWPQKHTLPEN